MFELLAIPSCIFTPQNLIRGATFVLLAPQQILSILMERFRSRKMQTDEVKKVSVYDLIYAIRAKSINTR
jgi:hypothetical protein